MQVYFFKKSNRALWQKFFSAKSFGLVEWAIDDNTVAVYQGVDTY